MSGRGAFNPYYLMLKKIRITLAAIFFIGVTLLLCMPNDFVWLDWMAKLQFFPAVLSLNVIALVIVVLLTLLFGRIYCSVICPLGILQDIIGKIGIKARKTKRPYSYSPAKNWLRYSVLILFIIAIVAGIGSFVALLAPYGTYGLIVRNIMAPTLVAGITALVILLAIGFFAWRNGRTYCNTICPVGTTLGLLSRFSLLKPVIDTTKCNGCKACASKCKAACINPELHKIDYSRCVACMDCLDNCRQGAIKYTFRKNAAATPKTAKIVDPNKDSVDSSKRDFFAVAGVMVASYVLAQTQKVDGGLAEIVDKKSPTRKTPILPPGAVSAKHFAKHCTGCQLCVSACPNKVLRPSGDIVTLMQPQSSYEFGFCRPECTKCSEVCPSGAIKPITREEKPDIQIGLAVVDRDRCVKLPIGDSCGNCARHCPAGAITMEEDEKNGGILIPVVHEDLCIGCGACEYLCPVRPLSAIHVEGFKTHRRR